MKTVIINDNSYELVKDNGNCFLLEEAKEKVTDYFEQFDYILGDYAYDKLRLKGFYESSNKNVKELNDIKNLEYYIKNYCAYGAKYFLLKKMMKNK